MNTSTSMVLALLLAIPFGTGAARSEPTEGYDPGAIEKACPAILDRTGARGAGAFDRSFVPISKEPPPRYPKSMLEKGQSGLVLVRILVGLDGSVIEAEVVKSTHADFEPFALESVRKWKWPEPVVDGKPICIRLEVEIGFQPR